MQKRIVDEWSGGWRARQYETLGEVTEGSRRDAKIYLRNNLIKKIDIEKSLIMYL